MANYDKYNLVSSELRQNIKSVLDVGCRDAILRRYLSREIRYTGIDLMPGPGVEQLVNVEDGLPFRDDSFDAVVALDLIEHTDNIWFVFDELLRVARHKVIIIIPNSYHWSFRLQYLLGNEMSKYELPSEPIRDRHRWIISYDTAQKFCLFRTKKQKNGWKVSERIISGGRRYSILDKIFTPFSKNLSSWAVVFIFEKDE